MFPETKLLRTEDAVILRKPQDPGLPFSQLVCRCNWLEILLDNFIGGSESLPGFQNGSDIFPPLLRVLPRPP